MAEPLKAEFDAVLAGLQASITHGTEALSATPKDPASVKVIYEEFDDLFHYLKKFWPKASSKNLPYNFGSAATTLVQTKRILVKIWNELPTATVRNKSSNAVTNRYFEGVIPLPPVVPFAFLGAFRIAYLEKPISKTKKLLHLQENVIGDPALLIKDLEITDDNLEKALPSFEKTTQTKIEL